MKMIIALGITAVVCAAAYMILSSLPHEIIIDGNTIAKTASLADAKQSVTRAKIAIAGKQLPENIRLPQKIDYRRASGSTGIISADEASEIVSRNISAESLLYTITADGKPVAALYSKDDAESVVAKLKTYYDDLPGDIKGESSFKEKIRIDRQYAPLRVAFASVDEAIELLTSYTQLPKKHIVTKGERATSIADTYHIPISDLTSYNPEIDIAMLEPDQRLIIHPGFKPVTVVTKVFVTMTAQLKPPSDVYRRSRKITGNRTTKRLTVYENGLPVQSEIVSQVTTWKRPKIREYRRKRKPDQTAVKPAGTARPITTATPPSPVEGP